MFKWDTIYVIETVIATIFETIVKQGSIIPFVPAGIQFFGFYKLEHFGYKVIMF